MGPLAAISVGEPLGRLAVGASQAQLAIELAALAASCGVPPVGTKGNIRARLTRLLLETHQQQDQGNSCLLNSIDVGHKNFAWAQVQVGAGRPRLLKWETMHLDLPEPYQPREFALQIQKLVSHLERGTSHDQHMLYLIERQRHRTMGGPAIPEYVFTVNRIESQLHALLLHRHVLAIDPKAVASSFGLGGGRSKKADAVRLVVEMLAGPESLVDVPPSLAASFQASAKRDDLADSLLQALTFHKWQASRQNLLATMLTGNGNAPT